MLHVPTMLRSNYTHSTRRRRFLSSLSLSLTMSTTSLLRFSLSPDNASLSRRHELLPLHYNRRPSLLSHSPKLRTFTRVSSKAVELRSPTEFQLEEKSAEEECSSTVLLDVSGMMCGACVTRVKSIVSADERVDSVVVNMLTETAAIKLKEGLGEDFSVVAEDLAKRVSASGFDARRRVSGMGVEAKVRKWRETVEKKDALLVKSRNRVAFAWTLVALCCGSHASHILHSVGIHVGHGENFAIAPAFKLDTNFGSSSRAFKFSFLLPQILYCLSVLGFSCSLGS